MEAFYPEIRTLHIFAVLASGAIFFTRTVTYNLSGAPWAMAHPTRILSYTVDTVLLTAALMLTTIVRQFPFVDAWLTVKVLLLPVYICLGYFALRASTLGLRLLSFAGAIAVYGYIIMVARAHDPAGPFV